MAISHDFAVTGLLSGTRHVAHPHRRRQMVDPDELETGFYWIQIGQQEAEVAQWQAEWDPLRSSFWAVR
jgi:hypothetical protein